MDTREKIMKQVLKRGSVKTNDFVASLGLSRQAISRHLRTLVHEGALVKTGSTRNSIYSLPKKESSPKSKAELKLIKQLKNLEEDKVYEEANKFLSLKQLLNENVGSIVHYAFCEMLNNAIDHSGSNQAEINLEAEKGSFNFTIRDFGIGIFKHVQDRFKLKDEYEATEHVFKGKQTTAPEFHSGEGIFFTSRIADKFMLQSHKLKVVIDNENGNVYYSNERTIKGTLVSFVIKQRSKKKLDELFKKYSDENYVFDRNDVRIKLSEYSELVSRSQARRLLNGLDKFRRITLDFNGVKGLGQAFADEVFRVFTKRHPNIFIDFTNANKAIEFMILRSKKTAIA